VKGSEEEESEVSLRLSSDEKDELK
jgi:hypothetical protein